MRGITLCLVRLFTGLYLVLWAGEKLINTNSAINLSQLFNLAYFDSPSDQHKFALMAGAVGVVVGTFVILGFFRSFFYSLQLLGFAAGFAAAGKIAVINPEGLLALLKASGTSQAVMLLTLLLFPLGLFLMSLAQLVWKRDDLLSLDRLFDWMTPDAVEEAAAGLALAATAAHAASAHDDHGHAAPAHDAHGHDDHGHAAPAHDDHGHDAHAAPVQGDHGHDDHGHNDHGHAAPAHDDHGHDAHAQDDHGHDDHGHDDHGHGAPAAHGHAHAA